MSIERLLIIGILLILFLVLLFWAIDCKGDGDRDRGVEPVTASAVTSIT